MERTTDGYWKKESIMVICIDVPSAASSGNWNNLNSLISTDSEREYVWMECDSVFDDWRSYKEEWEYYTD